MQTLDRTRTDLSVEPNLLLAIKRIVTQQISGAQVILYGSHCRSEGESDSDVDLLILLPDETLAAAEEALDRALYALELDQKAILSTLVYRQSIWEQPAYRVMPLRQNIEREGILL